MTARTNYQSHRALESDGIDVVSFLNTVINTAGLVGPWIWVPLIWVLTQGSWQGRLDLQVWFCWCLATPTVVPFMLTGLWVGAAASHTHWEAPGYLFLFPPLGRRVANELPPASR